MTLQERLRSHSAVYMHEAADALDRLEAENRRLTAERQWRPIETAPKDGRAVFLLNASDKLGETVRPPLVDIGYWHPEGTSWVNDSGEPSDNCYALAVTGVWYPSGGGWYQPNEVTHWMPLPDPPALPQNE